MTLCRIKQVFFNHFSGSDAVGTLFRRASQDTSPPRRSVPVENLDKYDRLVATIKWFLYSWMKPGNCETEEEMMISKALLFRLLTSTTVHDIFMSDGGENCPSKTIIAWIRNNVEPLEDHYLHYERFDLRHFDTHMNTAHEGTNNSAKSHGAPVLACHSVAQAARTLDAQMKAKVAEIKQVSAREHTSEALWSDLPLKADVTELCLRLVVGEWTRSINYSLLRVCAEMWRIIPKSSGISPFTNEDELKGRIPVFHRIRYVSVCNGRLRCSCGSFERNGYPCCHSLAVLRKEFPEYTGPNKEDTALCWHSCYALYGERQEDYPGLHDLFKKLRVNEPQAT